MKPQPRPKTAKQLKITQEEYDKLQAVVPKLLAMKPKEFDMTVWGICAAGHAGIDSVKHSRPLYHLFHQHFWPTKDRYGPNATPQQAARAIVAFLNGVWEV